MALTFQGPQAQVLVAVKSGCDQAPAVAMAASLCRRTGMRLRLVAVIEESHFSRVRYSALEAFDFTSLGRVVDEEQRDQAERALKTLAASLDCDSPVTTAVVVGPPAQAIIAEAVTCGAALLIAGAAKGSHHFVPTGLSTALSLMADSPVPVMIVQDGSGLDLTRPDLRLLVADDFSDSSSRAVLAGYDLATALGTTDVYHVHADSLNLETFAQAYQRLKALRGAAVDKDLDPAAMWAVVQQDLLQRIRLRAADRAGPLAAAGGRYWPELCSGGVEAEIERVIDATHPDILAFGRHQSLHRRPFSVGKVPFHFMLSQKRVLLIVPAP